MSWSGNVVAQRSEAKAALDAIAVSPDSNAPEQVEQVKAAKAAATALLDSGAVVNDDNQDAYITIGGHANPKHEPAAGYVNDTISVTVSQISRQAADA